MVCKCTGINWEALQLHAVYKKVVKFATSHARIHTSTVYLAAFIKDCLSVIGVFCFNTGLVLLILILMIPSLTRHKDVGMACQKVCK